jgi:glucose-1-phosphate thymidylyltransferase
MHLVLPLGGRGTRLLPHTRRLPKSLLHLAGDTVLGHVLARLADLDFARTTVIVGPDGGAVEGWLRQALTLGDGAHRGFRPGELTFLLQPEQLGQSQALALAADRLQGETLIVFADTLFELDWPLVLDRRDGLDGHLFVRPVADPSALGVALLRADGTVGGLVEKPTEPVSDLAIMGLYHLRDGAALAAAIAAQLAAGNTLRGEAYLADALNLLVAGGARLGAQPVRVWEDCGRPEEVIRAHRYLLRAAWQHGRLPGDADWLRDPRHLSSVYPDCAFLPPVAVAPGAALSASVIGQGVVIGPRARIAGSVLGPRVLVEPDALVEDSRVGPDVSLGAASRCIGARLSDVVLGMRAAVLDAGLTASILSPGAEARGRAASLGLGEGETWEG